MSRLVPGCLLALLVAVLPAAAAGRRAPAEVRSARQLLERVEELSAFGTVVAGLVEDTGAEPRVQLGTFAPTRKVTITHATVLRVIDGAVHRQPLAASPASLLFPSSLWSEGLLPRPEESEAMLVVAQRVGDTWVAFPEWSSRLSPGLLER